ncbi:Na+/H+ antiporter subunit E [Motiliproteus sediminis]|uniref:Na+/H+ antiporter subunit E n=1 Tax=Motiliproteus sediminis TaxID=1468178 RepID=UPI001AEFE61C|nr:Na+/H+ antiporter subunit E [Motiliproteus sediminis]
MRQADNNVRPIASHLVLALLLLTGWLLLVNLSLSSLMVGIPTVLAALWSMTRLNRPGPQSCSLAGVMVLAWYFLGESVRSGWDLICRCTTRRVRVSPGFIVYPITLRRQAARNLFITCVNLLPGTLSVRTHNDGLTLHVIDTCSDNLRELNHLEQLVATALPDGTTESRS